MVSSEGSGEAIYRRGEGHELGCRRGSPAKALPAAAVPGRGEERDEGCAAEIQRHTGQRGPREEQRKRSSAIKARSVTVRLWAFVGERR